MKLGKLIRKKVSEIESFFNEYLEKEGRVFLEYSYKMNNSYRDPEDRFRILLYPENVKGKLVFYCSGNYMESFDERIAKQFKKYCIGLEGVKESEAEYKKIWKEVVGMYHGPDLIKIDFSTVENDGEIGNNIPNILDERLVSINEMAIDLNMTYAGMHRLVTREDLSSTKLKNLIDIADYLKVEIQELYK